MKKPPLDFTDCIRVVANVHDLDTNRYSIELEFRNTKDEWSSAILPRRITSSGYGALKELLDLGAKLPTAPGQVLSWASCSASCLTKHIRSPARLAGTANRSSCPTSRLGQAPQPWSLRA